jgi:hypothetical protein
MNDQHSLQKRAANLLAENGYRGPDTPEALAAAAQQTGVAESTIVSWLQQPDFAKEVSREVLQRAWRGHPQDLPQLFDKGNLWGGFKMS